MKNMIYNIDLKEISQRESERVEWKENGDAKDIVSSIVKTISAFANDISNFGGGYVVCGAREIKDPHGFPTVHYKGLTANKLKEIEGKVTQHCRDNISPPIVPIVQELKNPEDDNTRILVFIVIASPDAHTYRDGLSSHYYVRIARETREARNGTFTQLLLKKQKIEYFDRRVNTEANEADLDLLLFRDSLLQMGLLLPEKSLEDYLSDKEQIHALIPPLLSRINLDNSLHPKNFTVLLFGKEKSITRFYMGAYSVLSIYKGKDRSEPTAERYSLTGSIIGQAKKIIDLLNTQAYTAFDKTSNKPNQVKYPIRALQEAVVNAIVHRDYEIQEPIRITVFVDRIEIKSPGNLHWGVDKTKFLQGKASAKWRNQSFAEIFNRLQLAQSEGQGIPTIFRTMKEEGCPEPIFEIEEESITCILPAHPRHQIFREQQEIQDKIILQKYGEAKEQAYKLLEQDPYNFRTLDLYCESISKLGLFDELFEFSSKLDFYSVNSNTLINIAEVLSNVKGNRSYQTLASKALSIALAGKIEEGQIVKAVSNLKKIGEPEDVIKFVNDTFLQYPNLSNNSTLREKRATSKMDMAKKCIKTGKDYKNPPKTKARAWEMCRQLLDEAEHDLQVALSNVDNPYEKSFIEQHVNFLEIMKRNSKKPN